MGDCTGNREDRIKPCYSILLLLFSLGTPSVFRVFKFHPTQACPSHVGHKDFKSESIRSKSKSFMNLFSVMTMHSKGWQCIQKDDNELNYQCFNENKSSFKMFCSIWKQHDIGILFVIFKPLNLHWAFAHCQYLRRVRSISYRMYIHVSSRWEKTTVSHNRGKGTVDSALLLV